MSSKQQETIIIPSDQIERVIMTSDEIFFMLEGVDPALAEEFEEALLEDTTE